MISVLPIHRTPYLKIALDPLRYVWQVVLPLTGKRIPVSTECVLFKRLALIKIGGYASVKSQIIPEKTFARTFNASNTYRFILSDMHLLVFFDKRWSSQTKTAIRLWYPQCRQNPLYALGLATLLWVAGVGPFIALFAGPLFIQLLAAAVCIMYISTYAVVLTRFQPHRWWLHALLLPFVLVQESVLVLISMLRYEFSNVDWKGRNVCYPVLLHKQ